MQLNRSTYIYIYELCVKHILLVVRGDFIPIYPKSLEIPCKGRANIQILSGYDSRQIDELGELRL